MTEDTVTEDGTRHDAVPLGSLERIEEPPEVTRIGLGVYDALFEQLDSLAAADWDRTTECEPWTVRDMVAHLLGAAHGHASLREGLRQGIWGLRHKEEYDGSELDAMNDLQVQEHRHKTPDELVAELRLMAPRAVRTRANLPALMGRIPIPVSSEGSAAAGMPERTTLGELNRVIYTRDTFTHRIDIARAVDQDLVLDPEVDRRVVEDVAIEWSRRHGQPVDLVLTGPVGGHWIARGGGTHRVEMDAIEFCRVLSGRAPAEGLLQYRLLF